MENPADSYDWEDEMDWDWETVLQQLPHSPAVSIDGFLPLFDVESTPHDAKHEGLLEESTSREAIGDHDSFLSRLSALNHILLHDEKTVDEHSDELIQEYINSFLISTDHPPDISDFQAPEIKYDVPMNCEQIAPVSDAEVPSAENSADTATPEKQKGDTECGRQWRQRKKVYMKRLEVRCGFIEGECARLERSLSHAALESVTLRHELVRVKKFNARELNPRPGYQRRAEPAVLPVDSLQLVSMLCLLLLLLLLRFLAKHHYSPRLPAAAGIQGSEIVSNVRPNFRGSGSKNSSRNGGVSSEMDMAAEEGKTNKNQGYTYKASIHAIVLYGKVLVRISILIDNHECGWRDSSPERIG